MSLRGPCGLLHRAAPPAAAARMYAQCGSYFAPALIHLRSSSICSGVSGGFFESGGGIRSSGSSLETRRITSLESASPGTIADSCAPSSVSSRRSAFRVPESGPWQA